MSATTGESGDGSDTVSALADSHRREEKGMRGSASLPIVVGRRRRRRPNFCGDLRHQQRPRERARRMANLPIVQQATQWSSQKRPGVC